jgi:hypothetical protein
MILHTSLTNDDRLSCNCVQIPGAASKTSVS